MSSITNTRHRVAVLVLVAVAGLLSSSQALGSEAAAEKQGAQLLNAVQRGERDCDEFNESEFALIGEHVMGRMVGSPGAHESMDELMTRMMGEGGEHGMHEVMGERFTDCGNPPVPGGFRGMMGVMGTMMGGYRDGNGPAGRSGMMGASGGMMGGARGDGFGAGGMMAGRSSAPNGGNDDVGWGALAVGALAGILLGVVIASVLWRRRPLGGQRP